MGAMKRSDAYKMALARAQTNPALIEAIGSPILQPELFPATPM
jgi:hypothetical protein